MTKRKKFASALILTGALAVPNLSMTAATADPLLSGSCTITDPSVGDEGGVAVSVGAQRGENSTTVSYDVSAEAPTAEVDTDCA